jgi:hypothetical protein
MTHLKRIMRDVMSWIKIVNVIFLLTLVLLLALELALRIAFYVRDYLAQDAAIHIQQSMPNYTDDVIGFKNETKNFRGYPYKAFLGWVSPDIKGEYLNVENGRRVTELSSAIERNETMHFFGGSTMWGHGVLDKNTIPSLVSKQLKITTINYGEQAYNSRQELNLLIDNLDVLNTNDVVIFYDGVNDVYHNCRSYNSPNGHAREFFFKDLLADDKYREGINDWLDNLSLYRLVKGLAARISLNEDAARRGYHNSCVSPEYAERVANFVVGNWKVADAVLSAKGVTFLCALQPNPYTFNGTINYSMEEMKIQIGSVYPLIKEKARNLSCFVDYSDRLLVDNFTDSCCHVNERGNREISSMLSSTILTLINRD